jgi:hypothetical protein
LAGARVAAAAVVACLLAASLAVRGRGQDAPRPSKPRPPDGILQLEFGLRAAEEQVWDGSISVSPGEIIAVEGWHFLPPDRVSGSAWSLRARLFRDPREKYRNQDELPAPVLPNGVTVAYRAPEGAQFEVHTQQGNFTIRLRDVVARGRIEVLHGNAAVSHMAAPRSLTEGDATQHDAPALAARGADVYAAWIAYHNEASMVYFASRRDDEWTVERASAAWGDYSGTAVAVDGGGKVHVVWAAYRDDRWALVSRAFDPESKRWGMEQAVAPGGHRQMFPRAVTDSNGSPWVVWQEFRDANSDVYASQWRQGRWSATLRVSESVANDWEPAIAAAPDGAVWVAWDSYERGSYDVFLRPIREGKLGPVVPVTSGGRFHAHVSIGVDPANRVWLVWEESGANWGKDTGVLGNPGTALLADRSVRLVCYRDGALFEPETQLESAAPRWLSTMHQFPEVAIGAHGVPYVFFRHYLHRIPRPEDEITMRIGSLEAPVNPWHSTVRTVWDEYVAWFDGEKWAPPCELPRSTGRSRARVAAVPHSGGLLAMWPSDGRTYQTPRVRTSQLRWAALDASARPAPSLRLKPYVPAAAQSPQAAPTEGEDLRRLRSARWVRGSERARIFRGDLHRHTDISADSQRDGDIIDSYRYAIDAAALDFLAITDHTGHERNNYFCYDWWRTRQTATLFNNPGRFVAFFGYERTVGWPGGHRNVISARRALQPFRIADEEFTGVESVADRLFPRLRHDGDFAIPHTTATAGGTDWRADDSKAEPLVEIFQGLRGSYEEPATPRKGSGASRSAGWVWTAWSKGRRVGVIASSDHYSTHQSYACVYAPQLTPGAIHAALKSRFTYAATDNIVVKFEAVDSGGGVHRMGEEFAWPADPQFRAEVQGTAALDRVEVVGNGRILYSRRPGGASDRFTWRDQPAAAGTRFYYLRIVQANRQLAWSSLIWVGRSK